MKKFMVSFLALCLAVSLSACSTKKVEVKKEETKTTETNKKEEKESKTEKKEGNKRTFVLKASGQVIKSVYTFDGDKILTRVLETTTPYALVGLKDAEAAKKEFSGDIEGYNNVPGVKATMDFQDKLMVQTIEIDQDKLDVEKAVAQGVLESGELNLGMEETAQKLIKDGFTEEK